MVKELTPQIQLSIQSSKGDPKQTKWNWIHTQNNVLKPCTPKTNGF